jgi:asparagine N-glycosylation enzyme membrane subunit Stt3
MRQAQKYVNGELPKENQEGSGEESDGPTLQPGQGTDSGNGENSEGQSFDGTRQIGGIGTNSPTAVPALQHHRYVASSSQSIIDDRTFNRYAQITSQYTQQLRYSDLLREDGHVKVFQKVEGVKVEGSGGPAENTIQIAIELENEQTGTPVRYVQTVQTDENGNFETTLPYASEGVPDSYTVKPTQDYQMLGQVNQISQQDGQLAIRTTYWYSGEVTVTNEQVTKGETIQVQLEEMNSEELTQEIQGDGIIQPRQRGGQSSGDGSGEDGN